MTETSGLRFTFAKAGPGITCHWYPPGGDGECGRPAVQVAALLDGNERGPELTFCSRHMHIVGQMRRQYQSRNN